MLMLNNNINQNKKRHKRYKQVFGINSLKATTIKVKVS